jgi:Tfp pilus assembly protein PilF
MSNMLKGLEALLGRGQDNAELRYALAMRHFADGNAETALGHARAALKHDPEYSAAWRLQGKIELAVGLEQEAAQSFASGIEVAARKGDQQLVREMRVFLRRLSPSEDPGPDSGPGDAT